MKEFEFCAGGPEKTAAVVERIVPVVAFCIAVEPVGLGPVVCAGALVVGVLPASVVAAGTVVCCVAAAARDS